MEVRCYLLSLVVTTIIALTTSTVSWFVTNAAGEQAILALGAAHQQASIAGITDVLDVRLDLIELYHNHFHDWRQMEGLRVKEGRDLAAMQRFMAGWLLHYSRDAACCSGILANMFTTGFQPGGSKDRYSSASASFVGVSFAKAKQERPPDIQLLGSSDEHGGFRTNTTVKQIPLGQQWNQSEWTRDYWNWPLLTPGRFVHKADQLLDPFGSCEGQAEGKVQLTLAAAVDESEGRLLAGLELRACSSIYESNPATGQRELAGTFMSGFFLNWLQRQLAMLHIVTERKSFVMIVERSTGHLLATSDPETKLWRKAKAGSSSVTSVAPVSASDASDRTQNLAEAVLRTAPNGWPSVADMELSNSAIVSDWVRVSGYQRAGIDWIIIISTPPEEFLDGVLQRRSSVVGIALGVTLVGVMISAVVKVALHVLAQLSTATRVEPMDPVVPFAEVLPKDSRGNGLV
eukprot:TRINITY_DN121230_c0_g1_i1.p1 TRINITY_DN121230_c0_g1~~TRINITY_DN121230_c0_g1_i1.p1  ORF type:complete len:460 (-),score=53.05 TRINITY_DN121230_c0_g1_i1:501-1880(-)